MSMHPQLTLHIYKKKQTEQTKHWPLLLLNLTVILHILIPRGTESLQAERKLLRQTVRECRIPKRLPSSF